MRLTDASVAIRPRNPWEAIDLGVLLAAQHRRLLMTSWAMVTLPVFVLLSLALWNYPSLAIFVFWWLKPAYERLTLLILSQSLFGVTLTLRQALQQWPKVLKPQLLASLTWRRFSLSRSFTLPVQQLEGLMGPERAQRISVLGQKDLRAVRCLTCVGSILELCLWIGSMVLFYAFIPQDVEVDWSWRSVLAIEGDWNWLEHLTNAFYALVLVIWGPVYVSCGFTLYLNRRTSLEAWDVELVFRRLRQRLIGSAYALLLAGALLLAMPVPRAMADDPLAAQAAPDAPTMSCPLPPLDLPQSESEVAGPNSARLLNQALTSSASKSAIQSVLEAPPFKNPTTVSGWRLAQQPKGARHAADGHALGWLMHLRDALMTLTMVLANVAGGLLWALVAVLVVWIIWRYRAWIGTFVSRQQRPSLPRRTTPQQLFGLQVGAQSLPDDIAGSAEQLWQQQPREALSLLYRALLSRLLTDYQLPLKSADTEGQVLAHVAALGKPSLNAFSHSLTAHWQNLAYGHRLPPADAQQQLCDGWRELFSAGPRT